MGECLSTCRDQVSRFLWKENEGDSEFKPKQQAPGDQKEESDDVEEFQEEHLIEDINLYSVKGDLDSARKDDKSIASHLIRNNSSPKRSGNSVKDTTKNNTDTLPVDNEGSKAMLGNTPKSYSVSRSFVGLKDFVDLKGPISSEIFFSIKKTDILAEYQVGKILGEGSYGQVKLVRHRRTNMERAMKIIKKAGVSEEEKETMMKEVSILKSLDHPNIIKIFDLYEDDTKLYLITE